jgi:nucleotide-binding universal stress UspA family protein
MEILICTDGSPAAESAALLVARLGVPADSRITLLGVYESDGEQAGLGDSMNRMASSLGPGWPEVKHIIRHGQPVDQILAEAQKHPYDLVAVGSSGHQRGLRRLSLGSTTSKLARKIHTHLLVARTVPVVLDKVLICTSVELLSVETMRRAGICCKAPRLRLACCMLCRRSRSSQRTPPGFV